MQPADIYQAARAHSSPGLEKLAHKSELPFDWHDLVLPDRVLQQLKEVANSVRLRSVVHSAWRFDRKVGKHSGISVLFSGSSGTGKTMSASVLARELNLDLYKIDLSTVVSKYIGDTEKNLNRIFDEAEYSSAILFFDEADALFGKRSEVKDAHDRYSNIEVAFLLQRVEQFSGLAILATNISRNIDPAFIRRMHHIVEFPFPDVVHRERIWRGMFPQEAPMQADVDFPFLARQFELSGGNIRNVVLGAAFLAAEERQPIAMQHLARATGREFQKMGRLPSRADFREHFESISSISG
jgi:SpoVK/Ycf46/Vps4 family AAA+-type ATPase